MSFSHLGLSAKVLAAIESAGYKTPTPIQDQAIPHVLQRRDVLGIAQTGTGKTAAFVLPMLTMLEQGRARARMPRTLILEPTRELAAQVDEQFDKYGKNHKLNVALIIGGVSFGDQDAKLVRGVDVLIATPGRLLDHSERGRLLLSGVELLVIDEADRMLDMGFIPDIERIGKLVPFTRQTLFFTATMPPEIQRIADNFLHNPVRVEVSKPATAATTITQLLVATGRDPHEKRETLRRLIRSAEGFKNAIVFCNRKREVAQLHRSLLQHKFNAAALHGDLDQSARTAALESFRNGEVTLLVASDVAARGLDIPAVSHIFNFDVPHHPDDYVHRIGRTGRAGLSGTAITIVAPIDGKSVAAIERLIGQTIPWMGEPAPAETRESRPREGERSRRGGRNRGHSRERQPQPHVRRSSARTPRKPQPATAPTAAARGRRGLRRQPPARLPAAPGVAQGLITAPIRAGMLQVAKYCRRNLFQIYRRFTSLAYRPRRRRRGHAAARRAAYGQKAHSGVWRWPSTPTSTNARWRSRRSRSARSRRCARRPRRAITRSGTPTPPAITPRSIRRSTRRSRQSGTLAEADLENIYATYLSPTRLTERIDEVGSQVKGEIEQVMAMIDAAAGSASSYTESLADMSEKLDQSKDREGLRTIVESLVHTAKEMEVSNQQAGRVAQRLQARNPRSAGQSRSGAQRKPDRSAHPARQPQILRHHAGKGDRRRARQERGAVADADRHRSFQEFQRQFRPPDRRPGAAPGGDVGEAERQGPGHRRPLRRRGIRRHSAEHGAALGDHGRRPHPPRGDDQGTDEALDRRASRPRHDLDRRRHAAQHRHRPVA